MSAPGVQSFYQQISSNRRRSVLLVLILTAILGVFGFVIGFAVSGAWQGGVVAVAIAVLIALLLTSVSYFAGDSIVLSASGARQVNETTAPQLVNIVNELSIAANLPPPKVYLIEDTAPNAFATGRDPRHASVAITTGLLQKLDREELQGVIGHELAHVRNLDIRFTLLVAVLVGSIVLPALHILGRHDRTRPFAWQPRGRGRAGDHHDRGGPHPGHRRPDHCPAGAGRGQPPA
jgi:heat shock protein HtpX